MSESVKNLHVCRFLASRLPNGVFHRQRPRTLRARDGIILAAGGFVGDLDRRLILKLLWTIPMGRRSAFEVGDLMLDTGVSGLSRSFLLKRVFPLSMLTLRGVHREARLTLRQALWSGKPGAATLTVQEFREALTDGSDEIGRVGWMQATALLDVSRERVPVPVKASPLWL